MVWHLRGTGWNRVKLLSAPEPMALPDSRTHSLADALDSAFGRYPKETEPGIQQVRGQVQGVP
jgi:hypothetical protein